MLVVELPDIMSVSMMFEKNMYIHFYPRKYLKKYCLLDY